jgi:hypothetical protein
MRGDSGGTPNIGSTDPSVSNFPSRIYVQSSYVCPDVLRISVVEPHDIDAQLDVESMIRNDNCCNTSVQGWVCKGIAKRIVLSERNGWVEGRLPVRQVRMLCLASSRRTGGIVLLLDELLRTRSTGYVYI